MALDRRRLLELALDAIEQEKDRLQRETDEIRKYLDDELDPADFPNRKPLQ